jgi:hypothetical protein
MTDFKALRTIAFLRGFATGKIEKSAADGLLSRIGTAVQSPEFLTGLGIGAAPMAAYGGYKGYQALKDWMGKKKEDESPYREGLEAQAPQEQQTYLSPEEAQYLAMLQQQPGLMYQQDPYAYYYG